MGARIIYPVINFLVGAFGFVFFILIVLKTGSYYLEDLLIFIPIFLVFGAIAFFNFHLGYSFIKRRSTSRDILLTVSAVSLFIYYLIYKFLESFLLG